MKSLIISIVVGVLAFLIGFEVYGKYSPDLAPAQPINFSHKIHAGDHEMDCQFCHIFAERSRVSGVPNVQRCMGCHRVIKTDSPEVQKIHKYWNDGEAIPWEKVYNLPDYVYFPHKRHVRAGVECQNCHGPVQEMAVVKRYSSLQMGWCLSCHQQRQVENGKDCWTCHK